MPKSSLGFRKLQRERVRCADPALRKAIPREPITEATNTNNMELTSARTQFADDGFSLLQLGISKIVPSNSCEPSQKALATLSRVLHPKATPLQRQQTVQHTQFSELRLGSLLVPDKDQRGDRGGAVRGCRCQKAHVGSPAPVNGRVFERGESLLNQWPTARTQH